MTIKEAIKELVNSDKFQEDARTDARLRVFRQRYNAGEIKSGAAVNILTSYGYKIDVTAKKVKA